MRRWYLITLALISISTFNFAQDTTVVAEEDYDYYDYDVDTIPQNAPDDEVVVSAKEMDEGALETFSNDKDFQYTNPPTIAENLWQRFVYWLRSFIFSLFSTATTTDWGRVLVYAIAIAAIIFVTMMFLRVNAFKVFYKNQSASPYHVFHENIHEMDFDFLLRQALEKGDYRVAIRLTLLHALKILSDKEHIAWQKGKTNHDYVAEVKEQSVKKGLAQISFYFDYAWYGNFAITADLFQRVDTTFKQWRQLDPLK